MPTNELVKGFTINDEQHLIDVSSLDGEITETVIFNETIDCQDESPDPALDGNMLYQGHFDGETPIDTFQLSNGDCVKIYIDGTPYISYCTLYWGTNDWGWYTFLFGNLIYVGFGWFMEDSIYNQVRLTNVSQGAHTLKISKINQSRLPSGLVPKSFNYGNEQEVILASHVVYFEGSITNN